MYGSSKKRKRQIIARLIPKRPRLFDQKTSDSALKGLDSSIEAIESQISDAAESHEEVRKQMLLGIVSDEMQDCKEKMADLEHKLSSLKLKREHLISESDHMAILAAVGEERAKELTEADGAGNCCEGGCKREDIIVVGTTEVCRECGCTYCRMVLENGSDMVPYGEYRPGEAAAVSRIGGMYKPANHYAEIMAQFQGKKRTKAPASLKDSIAELCDRYKIPRNKRSPRVVRMFLKHLQQKATAIRKFSRKKAPIKEKKFTDYYKHETEISFALSGIPPPYMTPMQESRLTALYPMIVLAYKTTPRYLRKKKDKSNRKRRADPNNMNNFYTLYKSCEMLGYEEFLPYIPLPKSAANIDDNDENSWRHICKFFAWEYTPTR